MLKSIFLRNENKKLTSKVIHNLEKRIVKFELVFHFKIRKHVKFILLIIRNPNVDALGFFI